MSLSAFSAEAYRYLWDGSDPGWAVCRTSQQSINLSLAFDDASDGPRQFFTPGKSLT